MSYSRSLIYFVWLGLVAILGGCAKKSGNENGDRFSVTEQNPSIGGQPVVTLNCPPARGPGQLEFLGADILPGRGMNTFQIRAYLPGKGNIDVLVSPSLEEAQKRMNGGPDDVNGNESFKAGGALLLPFANRIRGQLSADRRTLTTSILGKAVTLVANWKGKQPAAVPHAMHGLILASRMNSVSTDTGAEQASVTGSLEAGDFGGHWLSKTRADIAVTLRRNTFALAVTARNAGGEDLPIGIGWHPYFALPSGNRAQARLHIPALRRALVNNYDDVFPTGKAVSVKDTPYDFTAAGGAPLNQLFLDDCFFDLQKTPDGRAVAEIIDPAAKYGVRITAVSPQIRAFQVYAPPERQLVVLEPQFNLADPYSKIWGKSVNTGMVVLKPGESVTYSVTLELFVPEGT